MCHSYISLWLIWDFVFLILWSRDPFSFFFYVEQSNVPSHFSWGKMNEKVQLPVWPRVRQCRTKSWIRTSGKHGEYWWCDSDGETSCLELLPWLIVWDFSHFISFTHNKASLFRGSLIQKLLEFTQILYWSLVLYQE